ncbi:hypothetical protein IDM40_25570 [Nocardiopsis sp. HNM0947]|uniref:DUF3558 domain-containing protein n=1 Tax=Nocardiopsis coralli TaxID=2772213 RepID=A0ABR9PDY8_9ACTN|nr:hypothetical protein [Nocardiopsis coralli]MBE3002041.1 hypothetical protein [Nocardiopsis coralli]
MTRALTPLPALPTVAGGLALALMLSACGGGDDAEQEPDTAAAEADGEQDGQDGQEQDVELVDPMQLFPEDLCDVLSDELYDDLLDEDGSRSLDQTDNGVPDEETLERGHLRGTCLSVATDMDPAQSYSVTYSLEIDEDLQVNDPGVLPVEEDEADPSIDLGERASAEFEDDGTGVDLNVLDGQSHVQVKYRIIGAEPDGEGDYQPSAMAEEDELFELAERVAEEIFAEIDSNR